MNMKKFLLVTLILYAIASCAEKEKEEIGKLFLKTNKAIINKKTLSTFALSKKQNVDSLNSTNFTLTLENKFDQNQNTIYSVTLLLAWKELKNQIGTNLSKFSNKELSHFNSTSYHQNVLKPGEYETEVKINKRRIISKGYFKISLPFIEECKENNGTLSFSNQPVQSFGFDGELRGVEINYYIDSLDFSLTFNSKKNNHEIILIMKPNDAKKKISFMDYLKHFEQQNKDNSKLYFEAEDKVDIPKIEFNLEKNFKSIIGSDFINLDSGQQYFIETFFQQNAFILNEYGAASESYGIIEAIEGLPPVGKEPLPKLMIFNQPFVVFLKRKNSNYPYFAVYIANTELLVP